MHLSYGPTRYMLAQPSQIRWLIFFLILLIALVSPFASVAADNTRKKPLLFESVDKNNVTWKHLSFKGEELFAEFDVDVELMSQTLAEINTTFISSPQGTLINAPESGAYVINTKTSINALFQKVELQNVAWFDPGTLSTMQYIRQRTGLNDTKKTYRFTDKGVFRFTRLPLDKHEASQVPKKWSGTMEKFYSYSPAKTGCMGITVPMPIIYYISASKISDFEKPVTICVFNKKRVIYLDIQKESVESIQLNHIEIKGKKIARRNTSIVAEVLSLKARSTAPDKKTDNFTLVGLQGNIKIYIDPEKRIPVQLKGDYKGFGKIKLILRKMVYQ